MKLLLLIFLLTATTASSQTNGWRQLNGPYGWGFTQIPFDRTFTQVLIDNDTDIYALTINGTIYHRDKGTWYLHPQPINGGNGLFVSIAIDNKHNLFCFNTDTFSYTHPGIYKSTNRGNSWIKILQSTSIQKIVESKSGRLYAYQGGPKNSNTTIYVSTNQGDTWDTLTTIPLQSSDFIVDKNDQCYFSIYSNSLDVVRYDPITGHYDDLSSSFSNVAKVYLALCHDTIIAKTTDAFYYLTSSNTWKRQSVYGFPTTEEYPWRSTYPIFTTKENDRLITASAMDAYSLVSSTDLGKSWNKYYPTQGGIVSTMFLACIDSTGCFYLMDTDPRYNKGIRKGNPSGINLLYIDTPLNLPFLQEGPNRSLFIPASETANLFNLISYDNGYTWNNLTTYFLVDPKLVGHFTKDHSGGFLYVSENGIQYCAPPYCNTFEPINSSVIKWEITSSAISKKNVFVVGLYKTLNAANFISSADHGFSWSPVARPLSGFNITSINTNAIGSVYVGGYSSLYKSEDEGNTWNRIQIGIQDADIVSIKFENDRILLGTSGDGLWQSADNGTTWSKWVGLPSNIVNGIEVYGDRCYCITPIGLYSCQLDETVWKPELYATEQVPINQLLKTSDGKLYATVRDQGLWVKDEQSIIAASKKIEKSNISITSQSPQSITVAFDASGEQRELSLYNILGNRVWYMKVVSSNDAQPLVIPTTSLVEGLYYIMLKSSKENESAKVLIHH